MHRIHDKVIVASVRLGRPTQWRTTRETPAYFNALPGIVTRGINLRTDRRPTHLRT